MVAWAMLVMLSVSSSSLSVVKQFPDLFCRKLKLLTFLLIVTKYYTQILWSLLYHQYAEYTRPRYKIYYFFKNLITKDLFTAPIFMTCLLYLFVITTRFHLLITSIIASWWFLIVYYHLLHEYSRRLAYYMLAWSIKFLYFATHLVPVQIVL